MGKTNEIAGFRKYTVDDDGTIVNKRTNQEKKTRIDKDGYVRVALYDDDLKRHLVPVHRIVANAFIKKVKGKDYINHKDGDKTNNHFSNLEWCSIAENNWHKRNVLGKKNGSDKKKILCIETGEIFRSILEATKAKNLRKGDISHALNKSNYHKTAGGYHWALLEGGQHGE